MSVDVVVPQIGEAVAELTLVQWLKQPGDLVKRGDVLFEIDSDKAIVEVEAFADGVLGAVLFPDGSAVMPLQVVAIIETEPVQQPVAPPSTLNQPAPPTTPATTDGAASNGNGLKASPIAERMAADLQVDLHTLKGSGAGGRITANDVRRHAETRPSSPMEHTPAAHNGAAQTMAPIIASPKARLFARQQAVDLAGLKGSGKDGMVIVRDVEAVKAALTTQQAQVPASVVSNPSSTPTTLPLSRQRQIIARRMVESKQQVPHFYLMADVNMTRVNDLRRYCVEVLGWAKPPTYTDVLIRACALAFAAVPDINRSFAGDSLTLHQSINIGVAVSTDGGLVVPIIENPTSLSLRQTSLALREAAGRAREGRLRPADMGAKSMTISNLGMYAVDAFIAIIDMPDPMILAVGRVAERVVPVNGQAAVQPMCTLTLSADHRVLDGVLGAQFLQAVTTQLEQPFALLGSES